MKTILTLAVLLASLGFWVPIARAEGSTPSTFALIVTNNRSARLSRPDLRYADDDGAKYYEMFRMLAPESNVRLLTTFDRDTQKLFPHLVGKESAPSKAQVQVVVKDFVEQVKTAKLRGPVDFYFVFAGHGDIDKGKGFLELSDGPFTSDDLESLLTAIPATRSHVILDSCNSFFVINSRKPGGRHFVTSEEATKSLSTRLPNVGVFLSTSAEAEVYEWSELQSGVFSHAVRSGLSGAADANRDGRVSYDELRAFVNVASKDIKNANFRPQVFARGPGGRGGDAVVDLTNANGVRVRIDAAERRLTVRDQDEVPWIDMHKEAGAEAVLHLPTRVAEAAVLDESSSESGAVLRRYSLRRDDSVQERMLASLEASPAATEPRGPDDMFRRLFARPFGPIAYAESQADEAKAEPLVLGVSADQRERMRLVLRESADAARSARHLDGAFTLSMGLGIGALSGETLATSHEIPGDQQTLAAVFGGLGIAGGAYLTVRGLIDIVSPSLQERTYEAFTQSLALAPDTQRAQALYAEGEQGLLKAATRDRQHRTWTRWAGFGVACESATSLVIVLATSPGDIGPIGYAIVVVPLVYGGALFFESLFPTATERMAELWKNDPGLVRSRSTGGGVQIKPVFGLTSVGISGTF